MLGLLTFFKTRFLRVMYLGLDFSYESPCNSDALIQLRVKDLKRFELLSKPFKVILELLFYKALLTVIPANK
jgi:hypothetical protein